MVALLKDYNISILYHRGKVNITANTLSRLFMGSMAHVEGGKEELMKYVHRLTYLGVRRSDSNENSIRVHNGSKSLLVANVKAKQDLGSTLVELKKLVVEKKVEVFSQGRDGMPYYRGRLYVPNIDGLRNMILNKAHNSSYSIL